jgi:D-threo-aldose 1-dehydrogenase
VLECEAVSSRTARLGFGCSNLSGGLNYRKSCALLEAAFESGFRYFDVAPAYGHGQAERIVGDVLHSVRDQIEIVTKVGIARPKAAPAMQVARALLSPVKRMMPGLWSRGAKQVRKTLAPAGCFEPAYVAATVEESLRYLRTDRVDALLLHEALPTDVTPALMDALDALAARKTFGALGLGTSLEATVQIIAARPGRFPLLQVGHYWGAFDERLGQYGLMTHRCVRVGMKLLQTEEFRQALAQSPELHALRATLADARKSPQMLLIAGALRPNVRRIIVSSSKAERVKAFMLDVQSSELDAAAVEFNQLVAGMQALEIPGSW